MSAVVVVRRVNKKEYTSLLLMQTHTLPLETSKNYIDNISLPPNTLFILAIFLKREWVHLVPLAVFFQPQSGATD